LARRSAVGAELFSTYLPINANPVSTSPTGRSGAMRGLRRIAVIVDMLSSVDDSEPSPAPSWEYSSSLSYVFVLVLSMPPVRSPPSWRSRVALA